jgi:hypothetical protein
MKRKISFAFLVLLLFSTSYATTSLFIIRSIAQEFEEVANLVAKYGDWSDVSQLVVTKETPVSEIRDQMIMLDPDLVILMDNKAVQLYKLYQKSVIESKPPVPSVAVMGIMLDQIVDSLKNSACISYEIPLVTVAQEMRTRLNIPFNTIGVVHRQFMTTFIEKNRDQCNRDSIYVVNIAVPDRCDDFNNVLRGTLDSLVTNNPVHILWIPNDSGLITESTYTNVWKPFLEKHRIPVIVGIKKLVHPDYSFGTFALIPDKNALAEKTVEIGINLINRKSQSEIPQVYYPEKYDIVINTSQIFDFMRINARPNYLGY